MAMNLADLIDRNANHTPDKPALRFGGSELTYAAFASRIAATARALASRLGVRRGDRVAILATSHPDYLVLLYACARLGAILVPLNWRLVVPELLFILSDAGVKVLVVEQAFAEIVEPLLEQSPGVQVVGFDHLPASGLSFESLASDDSSGCEVEPADLSAPLLLVYTSGTTGRPKGAMLSQEALLWNGVMSQHAHGLTSDDHVLTVLPLFHVGGLNIQTTPALHLGATVSIHARFTPEATLGALTTDRPTLVVLVPATIQALIDHPDWPGCDLSSLRAVTTGSTQVPVALIDAFNARGVPVLQVYGSTETCPIVIYSRLGGDLARRASTGLPGLFCEARIVDENGRDLPAGELGEILVRAPNLFLGYWRNEQATREAFRDGWYCTGDIATRDADGYYYIRDRKKNLIISGGENIYPAEVERVLGEHPAVLEAAVIGRPDPRWQEVPVAYIVPRPGKEVAADALMRHAGSQLARFKLPREIIFTDDLPRNALGKVQHFRLKDRLLDHT
jgi:fatty-acyl-CoA synthase